MNAEMLRVLVLAAAPVLVAEIFLGTEYVGVNRKFDAILMGAVCATIGFMLIGAIVADYCCI